MTVLVGPVVGPIGISTSTGVSRFSDPSKSFDFAIGGLGFRVASTDDTPYVRQTAAFRKEQFDSSSTPGEQALDGWWLRSQLSFHKGAGITYYEVLDGDTVLNRCSTSTDLDLSVPGRVSLRPDWRTWGTVAAATDAWMAGNVLFVLDGTTLKFGTLGALANYAVVGTGTVVTATTEQGGTFAYAATTANKIERITAAGAGTVIYTHTAGITNLFHAKGRLWVIDANNKLYTLTPDPAAPPVAIAAGDLRVTFFSGSTAAWRFASTPGAVFVSQVGSGTIYSLTVDSTGAVPTLTGPVVAAELPASETLKGLGYTLGHLILVTSKGVRVGQIDQNGTVFGPLVAEFVGSTRGIAAIGETAYVVGGTSSSVYALDLGNMVDSLQPAWSVVHVFGETDGGVLADSDGNLVFVGVDQAVATYADGTLVTAGSLQTGLHRFGTLEPKQFHSVRVRLGGDGGSVAVSRVDADGTTTSLISLSPLDATSSDVTLRLDTPAEAVGLLFTLTRDGTDATAGPVLLGYQLRALPAPTRARVIKVPLLIQDTWRNRNQVERGRRGDAWPTLRALEELESSTALVPFMDYRTGESGTAYIEEVAFRGDTPSVGNSTGFGGVCYVTLRAVS